MSGQPEKPPDLQVASCQLLGDLRRLIEETRAAVAAAANAGLTMLYWRIGQRVNQEILQGKRADYGTEIISTVSRQLELD